MPSTGQYMFFVAKAESQPAYHIHHMLVLTCALCPLTVHVGAMHATSSALLNLADIANVGGDASRGRR